MTGEAAGSAPAEGSAEPAEPTEPAEPAKPAEPAGPAPTVGSRAGRVWGAWSRWERVAVVGLGVLATGGVLEGLSDSRSYNGATGAWPILLAIAASLLIGLAMVGRARRREIADPTGTAGLGSVLIGAAAGLVVLGSLEAIDVARTTDLDPLGGVIGAAGRGLALVGSVIAFLGLFGVRRSLGGAGWLAGLRGGRGLLLLRVGMVLVIAGWVVLTALGDGFAMRSLDALGLETAIVAGLGVGPGLFGGDRATLLLGIVVTVLAAVTTVAALDGATQVLVALDGLLAGPTAGLVGVALLSVGVALIAAGALSTLRRALPSRRATGSEPAEPSSAPS